jgi:hypothetical protein
MTDPDLPSKLRPVKCTCVYATSENSEDVRRGFAMGGYIKEECQACKDGTSDMIEPEEGATMTDLDLVARLARESGMMEAFGTRWQSGDGGMSVDLAELASFAALVAEECAKVCDALAQMHDGEECAAAIRARFVHSPPAAPNPLA